MDDGKKSKVIQLFKDNATPASGMSVSGDGNIVGATVTGNGNVLGNNNTVIHSPKVMTKTMVTVSPGAEHISEQEAARLKQLVSEIVSLEKILKRQPRGYQAVWGALNRHCKVTQYRMIRGDDYSKAEKYLRQWIGRLSSTKSAPKKTPDWRKKKYAYIKNNCRQLGLEEKLSAYIRHKFDKKSISELTDGDLEKVYRAVAGWKRS